MAHFQPLSRAFFVLPSAASGEILTPFDSLGGERRNTHTHTRFEHVDGVIEK